MGLRIHPREKIVNTARAELGIAFAGLAERHGLTEGEELKIIMSVCADHVLGVAKTAIREERHGDPDKAGGLIDDDDKG